MELRGVQEHREGDLVSLVYHRSGRLAVNALNECGNRDTAVDLWELINYLRLEPPEGRNPDGFTVSLEAEANADDHRRD